MSYLVTLLISILGGIVGCLLHEAWRRRLRRRGMVALRCNGVLHLVDGQPVFDAATQSESDATEKK